MAKEHKQLKDLNLLDRFLFAEAMDDPEILRNMLEIILGKDIVFQQLPQPEKEKRKTPLQRFVKLDVWAMDVEETVYDAEVQKENAHNLPKRSRLYQGLIDSDLLPPGIMDFNRLNNAYIIIITPFDPFGKNLYRYSFEMQCREVPSLSLKDGAIRIFLNTHGQNASDVSPELIELLRYMENTSEETSQQCQSSRIKEMQKRIQAIKSSEEIGVKFMLAWEEKLLDRQKAREKGKQLQLLELVRKKAEKGWSCEKIAETFEESAEYIHLLMDYMENHPDFSDEDILIDIDPTKYDEDF